MTGGRLLATMALATAVSAGPAMACTILLPAPRAGETLAQVAFRQDRLQQQRLRHEATAIYLARVIPTAQGPYFRPSLSIEGARPPRRASASPTSDCEPSTPAPGELRLVFTRTIGPSDDVWRPWRWGRPVVIGSRRPAEVADPGLAAALRKAAARIAP
jgi:hypothetical protein